MAVSRSFNLPKPSGHFCPELVQRRVMARWVQQLSQTRRVAVEVAAEQLVHAPDGAVTPALVEQLADEGAQLALVAKELLQCARQAPVTVPEILSKNDVQRRRRTLVEGVCALQQRFELAPHQLHIQCCACVLDGQQADAQCALNDLEAALFWPSAEETGKRRLRQRELVDEDAIPLNAHS